MNNLITSKKFRGKRYALNTLSKTENIIFKTLNSVNKQHK